MTNETLQTSIIDTIIDMLSKETLIFLADNGTEETQKLASEKLAAMYWDEYQNALEVESELADKLERASEAKHEAKTMLDKYTAIRNED